MYVATSQVLQEDGVELSVVNLDSITSTVSELLALSRELVHVRNG